MSTRAKWRAHIQAWRASGETAATYCGRANLNASMLQWWAWKLGSDTFTPDDEVESRLPTFVELAPMQLPADQAFELEIDSILVRVPVNYDAANLSRLLDTLEARRAVPLHQQAREALQESVWVARAG